MQRMLKSLENQSVHVSMLLAYALCKNPIEGCTYPVNSHRSVYMFMQGHGLGTYNMESLREIAIL
jgi:hypothetical protein